MALSFLGVLWRPTERGLQRSFRNYCYVDVDGVRAAMGESYDWMSAYALDRFRTASVKAAMRGLLRAALFDHPGPGSGPDRRADDLDLGPTRRRHRLNVAEAASRRHGWPLYVIDERPR